MNEYNPDYVSPPGDTIADLMEERGIAIAQVIESLNISPDRFFWMLVGDLPVDVEVARGLELAFDVPAAFWVERSLLYQNFLGSLSPLDRLREMDESRQKFARFRPFLFPVEQSSGDDLQELPFFS
jgi:plasmid maintenance system antidote protein VapI